MVGTARPVCGGRADGDAQVTAYKARDSRQSLGCRTRVQGLRSGGQLSSGALSYLGAGFTTGFGDITANTWCQGSFHPYWTVPALELDSCPLASADGIGQYQVRNWTVCPASGNGGGQDGWQMLA